LFLNHRGGEIRNMGAAKGGDKIANDLGNDLKGKGRHGGV